MEENPPEERGNNNRADRIGFSGVKHDDISSHKQVWKRLDIDRVIFQLLEDLRGFEFPGRASSELVESHKVFVKARRQEFDGLGQSGFYVQMHQKFEQDVQQSV